jgi:PleD family two-component response regulator
LFDHAKRKKWRTQKRHFWISHAATAMPITISVVATIMRLGDNCESLLDRADQALYLAKEGGRNRIASETEISYMKR